ncbi:MAG: cytochrome c oxidase accessory protein CcoG [Burkholderiales bacterium]|nr:MAG: cytochrome c oxidase accessory protein CcoG [Burkholderiales bacterium]
MSKPQGATLYEAAEKIYPREIGGRFDRLSRIATITLLGLFYAVPWLPWDERQAVLFDLPARKFYIFALTLWPQDFPYLALLLMILAYCLFFFTAIGGRLWCGFACPQTVWTEIFIWMEQFTEGTRSQRMKLDKAPWGWNKFRRKFSKQFLWVTFSLWTGFTFVGYFTPIRELGADIIAFNVGGWTLFWGLFYGFATYGNAGYMREQVCTYMCPYARFQSAMFDPDTLVITYDADRGEPRGSRSRRIDPGAAGLGHCVDCALCVHVCPTGIDIRDGLQYQCIGCAACVDVCDSVMDRMGYPRGLIRYSTEYALLHGLSSRDIVRRALRPRTLVYLSILLAIIAAFVVALVLRTPLKVDIIRDRASLARIVEDGRIENVYRFQIMNATERVARYTVRAEGLPGIALASNPIVAVPAAQSRMLAVRVQVPPDAAGPGSHVVSFEIVDTEQGHRVVEHTKFLMPR